MSKTFTYTFTTPAGGFLTITTGDNPRAVSTQGGTAYQGYAITGISGTFNGETVQGLSGPSGAYATDTYGTGEIQNNTIFTDASQGDQNASAGYNNTSHSLDGIDSEGFAFVTTSGNHYNFYQY